MSERPPVTRLDQHLVQTGLARSRGEARQLITSGEVLVGGAPVRKLAHTVAPGQQVQVIHQGPRWVGRAALKLDHALRLWQPEGLEVRGQRCLDVGASTGGFTQVLLSRGASHVVALDVGHGQLAPELVADPRVRDMPGTHVLDATAQAIGGTVDVVVADLAFISLLPVLSTLVSLGRQHAEMVLLVKPQFEVGPQHVNRGGVVRSAQARQRALERVLSRSWEIGLGVRDLVPSPVTGTAGNHEYLLWVASARPGMMDPEAALARAAKLTKESR